MSDDSAWGICVDSTGEKPHKESTLKEKDYPWSKCQSDQAKAGHDKNSANKICGSIKAEVVEAMILKEKVGDNKFPVKGNKDKKTSKNRQVPVFNPQIKKGKIEPDIKKTSKGIGGKNLNQSSFLWKDILDSQLKQNRKDPKK